MLAKGWIWPEIFRCSFPGIPSCDPVNQASRTHSAWASAVQHCDTQFSDLLREASRSEYWSGENWLLPLTFLPCAVPRNNVFHSMDSGGENRTAQPFPGSGQSGNCPLSLSSGFTVAFELWVVSWQLCIDAKLMLLSQPSLPIAWAKERIQLSHCCLLACASVTFLEGFLFVFVLQFSDFLGFSHD